MNLLNYVMVHVSDEEITADILQGLVNKGYWTHGHTRIENAIKGVPSHDRGRAKKMLDNLIKCGWVLQKKTGHGIDVHLNINCKRDIADFVLKYSL